jgi:hypothetical protein
MRNLRRLAAAIGIAGVAPLPVVIPLGIGGISGAVAHAVTHSAASGATIPQLKSIAAHHGVEISVS